MDKTKIIKDLDRINYITRNNQTKYNEFIDKYKNDCDILIAIANVIFNDENEDEFKNANIKYITNILLKHCKKFEEYFHPAFSLMKMKQSQLTSKQFEGLPSGYSVKKKSRKSRKSKSRKSKSRKIKNKSYK